MRSLSSRESTSLTDRDLGDAARRLEYTLRRSGVVRPRRCRVGCWSARPETTSASFHARFSACTSASRKRSTIGTPGKPMPSALRTTLCAPSAPITQRHRRRPSSSRTETPSGPDVESVDAAAPFDRSAEGRQPIAERALDVRLGHHQSAGGRRSGSWPPDREARQFTSVDADDDASDLQRRGQADHRARQGGRAPRRRAVAGPGPARSPRAYGLVEHSHVDAGPPPHASARPVGPAPTTMTSAVHRHLLYMLVTNMLSD